MQFHQVVRATTPMFTLLLNYLFLNKNAPTSVYVSLIPVVAGVGLATYGDYYVSLLLTRLQWVDTDIMDDGSAPSSASS